MATDSTQTPGQLSAEELLSTTHAPDGGVDFERLVPRAIISECVEVALQSPLAVDGSVVQFLIVTDPGKRWAFAQIYREAHEAKKALHGGSAAADYLVDNLHRAAALVFACSVTAPASPVDAPQAASPGNALPAMWSFRLAARLHGLATFWTTTALDDERFHELFHIAGESVTVAAMTPVAFAGDAHFTVAARPAANDAIRWNIWQ